MVYQKKRVMSALLTVAMIFSGLPGLSEPARAEPVNSIYEKTLFFDVTNEKLTLGQNGSVFADNTDAWELVSSEDGGKKDTLVFKKDFTFETKAKDGLQANDDFIIELENNAKVTIIASNSKNSQGSSTAILNTGNLKIKGSGSMEIRSGVTTAQTYGSFGIKLEDIYGVHEYSLSLEGDVHVTALANEDSQGSKAGIKLDGGLFMSDNASVIASGKSGAIQILNTDDYKLPSVRDYDIEASLDVTGNGSTSDGIGDTGINYRVDTQVARWVSIKPSTKTKYTLFFDKTAGELKKNSESGAQYTEQADAYEITKSDPAGDYDTITFTKDFDFVTYAAVAFQAQSLLNIKIESGVTVTLTTNDGYTADGQGISVNGGNLYIKGPGTLEVTVGDSSTEPGTSVASSGIKTGNANNSIYISDGVTVKASGGKSSAGYTSEGISSYGTLNVDAKSTVTANGRSRAIYARTTPLPSTEEHRIQASTDAGGNNAANTGIDSTGTIYKLGTSVVKWVKISPPGGQAPQITTTVLDNGYPDIAYEQKLAAAGTTPITWSIKEGALPDGLSLADNGTISGTPTEAGSFDFKVKAVNAEGADEKSLSILIESETPDLSSPITKLTAQPHTLESTGGSSTITIKGTNLPGSIMVTAFDSKGNMTDITDSVIGDDDDDGGPVATDSNADQASDATASNAIEAATATSSNASGKSEDSITLRFPANESTTQDVIYTIKASVDGGDSWGLATCKVTVQKAEEEKEEEKVTSSKRRGSSSRNIISNNGSGTWNPDGNGWRYQNPDGSWAANQWALITYNGITSWYFFGTNGYMSDGWLEWNGHRYYMHAIPDGKRGYMYTGWNLIDGKWYYFNTAGHGIEGSLLVNATTPDGYQVGADGVYIP